MLYCSPRAWRWMVVALIIALSAPTLVSQPSTLINKGPAARFKGAIAHDDGGKKKSLSREHLAREVEIWHEINKRRLAESHTLGAYALTADLANQDVNDISVIQDDGRLVIPPNSFDLNGRAAQFTPSGSGYTITAGAAAFDNNLGSKLNLTVAPAVNPKPGTDPGDDAYIAQDLGFNFNFFGASFSSVAVSSNGNLTFRPSGVNQTDFDFGAVSSIASLAEFQQGLPRIAPYWHDLDGRAAQTQGVAGVFLRRDSDRVVITWNNIRDFPNDPATDRGLHRFQVTLFNDGRILFVYDSAQLTSQALAGVTPGLTSNVPSLVNLNSPPSSVFNTAIADFFSTSVMVDTIGAAQAFYATHPGQDAYDFVYLVTDFDFNLGGGAFAFYLPLRNDAQGIGQPVGPSDAAPNINSQRIQGILNLSNVNSQYPASPATRFLGANHALSIMGQEQGHRWLSYINYTGANQTILLGRDDSHWSFFYSIPSTISSQAAPRSSSIEGNVWRDNGNGTFTSINLIDGFSRLDQYIMGLRPASDVPDTFVIANPSGTNASRESNPFPNVTTRGARQNVTIDQIIMANGPRTPDSTTAPKNFRAAVVLLTRQGTQPSAATLEKITRYRLAWESYFRQSTESLATINTGLSDQTFRAIEAASAASFKRELSPGEISAIFGVGLTSGGIEAAPDQPLPTILAGTQVRINNVLAPLFYASPAQINFQVPRETVATTNALGVQSSTALIEVYSDGQLIRAGAFQIAPVIPAIFTRNQSGSGEAAALDAFTFAPGPFNAKQSNGQPNIIAIYGTGLGADATDVDGSASAQAAIDGAPATLDYAGRAPGFTGLNQFNLIFPANITSGSHTVVITRNGISSNQVTITVR